MGYDPSAKDAARHVPRGFAQRVGGIMPGYRGHRPGAREIVSTPAYGGLPFRMDPDRLPGQGEQLSNRPTTSWIAHLRGSSGERVNQDVPSVTDEFRDGIGGVKIGYTGFVPGAPSHFGTSHRGGSDGIGPPAPSRGSSWGSRAQTDPMGVLPIPSMTDPLHGDPAGYRPPKPQAPVARGDLSKVPLTYSGFKPRHFDKAPSFEPVGAVRHQSPTRTMSSRQPRTGSHNDWAVHQQQPPPPMPVDSAQYRQQVGGLIAGYSGFVPGSEVHCASSHLGNMQTLEQRGHESSKLTNLLRVPPVRDTSVKAGNSAVGYAGLRPQSSEGLGISYWGGDPAAEGSREAETSELYSA